MRPTLLHALFSATRAEILRLLFTNPRQELYVRQLARLSFLSLHPVQKELANLYAARIVLSRSNGYHRFYRANFRHSLFSDLVHLVQKSEQAPRIDHSTLQTKRKARRGQRARALPADRPMKWNIFTKRLQT